MNDAKLSTQSFPKDLQWLIPITLYSKDKMHLSFLPNRRCQIVHFLYKTMRRTSIFSESNNNVTQYRTFDTNNM